MKKLFLGQNHAALKWQHRNWNQGCLTPKPISSPEARYPCPGSALLLYFFPESRLVLWKETRFSKPRACQFWVCHLEQPLPGCPGVADVGISCISMVPDSPNARRAGKGSAGHLRLLNWPLAQMQPKGLFPSSKGRGQWWGGQGTDRACHWAQEFKTSHITITATTYQVPLVSRHHTDLQVLLLWKADRIMPILQLKKLRLIEFKWLFKASLTWE